MRNTSFFFVTKIVVMLASLKSVSAFSRRYANRANMVLMAKPEKSSETKAYSAIAGPVLPEVQSTSKRLFLVRHGEVINPGGDRPVYYGAMDVELSPLGKAEATAAAQYLSQFELNHIFSSPLSRAVYGAKEVQKLQTAETPVVLHDGFIEMDRGAWCGKTKAEIGKEAMAKFDACVESATPKGGESYPFLKARVLEARDECLEKMSAGEVGAVVSHLQVTRSMLSDAMGIPTEEMASLKIATASITCIDYDVSTGTQTVCFQSFKPDVGLASSTDEAN